METTISQKVFLDNASTTPIDERVFNEMIPYFKEMFGNASSNHEFGLIARKAIEKARFQVSNLINSKPREIIFTSGSTESINLALKGYVESNLYKGNHIITLKTEHKAVLNTCIYLESKGVEVTYLDVDENGLILEEELINALKEETILVSIMYVNNETGVIQDIKKISKILKDYNAVLFSDATQAVGKIDLDFFDMDVDMLCFSGHKINGPKGVGVLVKKDEIKLTPLIHGGDQERGLRSGTYNTPLIVGLGKACEIILNEFDEIQEKLNNQRGQIIKHYESKNIGVVNFKSIKTSPHIISITLKNIEAEDYLLQNKNEFFASTGSACNSEIIEFSHVLKAINIRDINKIIRLSF